MRAMRFEAETSSGFELKVGSGVAGARLGGEPKHLLCSGWTDSSSFPKPMLK